MLDLLKAFIIGGTICAIGQIMMDVFRLTPGPYYDKLGCNRCNIRWAWPI